MKERPILFSAPMVRAILEGRKTQTRRIVKPQFDDDATITIGEIGTSRGVAYVGNSQSGGLVTRVPCRYGQPGDRLWVRETHQFDPPDDGTWAYVSWAGCKESSWREIPPRFQHPRHVIYSATWQDSDLKWRPSIFMPRWASRITLEVTGVRVERLQDISEDDAKAEGLIEWSDPPRVTAKHYGIGIADVWETDPRKAYERLWGDINGPESWASNPWVWVIEFTQTRSE